MKALCEEMGLNTLATQQKYLAVVLSVLSSKELSLQAALVLKIVLIAKSTSTCPLIEYLVHISQLHKFHKVMI